MKNFFSPKESQKRIEAKINKYYDSIESEKIRSILDQMPKNKETLDIIESELSEFIKNMEGDSEVEKWSRFMTGVKRLDSIVSKKS